MKNESIVNNLTVPIEKVQSNFGIIKTKENRFDYKIEGNLSLSVIPVEITFQKKESINRFSYTIQSDEEKNIKIKVFLSTDGETWEKIPVIDDKIISGKREILLPFIAGEKLQVVFYKDEFFGFYNFGFHHFQIARQTDLQVQTSSNMDRLWVGENIFDGREDYGWASSIFEESQKQEINIEIDQSFFINEIYLKSFSDFPNLFPPDFQVLVSNDKFNWETVITESNFFINSASWVKWKFLPVKARHVKIIISKLFRLKKDQFQAKILEADIRAVPENRYLEYQNSSGVLASELIPGNVILSEMNGSDQNKVVQASDPRIRPASETAKGITQFAKDGETAKELAVQANDRRLRNASESFPGIAQFALDRENSALKAVQGNDSRIKPASETSNGIVRLAKDGEESYDSVVRSNDRRLKRATTESAGIVRLAKDGESSEGFAVQANDKRLRNASNAWPGIVRLADSNEKDENKVVRSNDSRLNEATETTKGRVVFARDAENSPLKAVQGSDSRLKIATEESAGIVRYAALGMEKSDAVVQANDPRLKDARKPLAHEHDYADKDHDLNSHKGNLNRFGDIKLLNSSDYNINNFNEYPLSVENKSGFSAAFKGGIISKGGDMPSLVAVSEKSSGLESRSRDKASGVFFSEKDYALHALAKYEGLKGSGLSILAEGLINASGGIQVYGEPYLAVAWDRFSSEVFHAGDLLTVGDSGNIEKMRNSRQYCIGVYVKKSDLVLYSEESKKDKSLLIGVSGIVPVRVTGKIKSGNFIGLNKRGDLRGIGEVVSDEKENKRIAIALESCDKDKERTIKALLIR